MVQKQLAKRDGWGEGEKEKEKDTTWNRKRNEKVNQSTIMV